MSQIDIPPDSSAHLMLLLHQTLACTVELQSSIEQASWHVKGTDIAPLYALLDTYTGLVAERLAALGRVIAAPGPVPVLMPAAAQDFRVTTALQV
jgi:DNA-binding ferritin-like protein